MKQAIKTDKLAMIIAGIFLIIIVVLALYLISKGEKEKGQGDLFVLDIIDGDTFKMSDGTIIRLLCVNTPEADDDSGNYKRATKFLESLVLFQDVRLEQGETLDKTDKYNRELRFVYVASPTLGQDEIFVNKEIIRLGFSEVYAYQDEEGECERIVG